MILLRTSTEKDIIERFAKIVRTEKRMKIFRQFNNKGLVKDRRIPDGAYLGMAQETICGVKAYIFGQKRSYYHDGKYYAMAVFSELYEVVDPKDGRKGYITPIVSDGTAPGIDTFILFTPHFVKRLEERTGISFLDYNATHTGLVMRWVDNDGTLRDGSRYTVFGDMGYAVGGRDDDLGLIRDYKHDDSRIILARTFITDDMRFNSQVDKMDEQKERYQEFEQERRDNFHRDTTVKKSARYNYVKPL